MDVRFVRDKSFKFRTVWLVKNIGEASWSPGTQIIVGDQMAKHKLTVPLSLQAAVQPGEEADVVVDPVAPQANSELVIV